MNNEKNSYLIEILFCSKKYYAVLETNSNGTDTLLRKDGNILISHSKKFDNVIFVSEDITVYNFDNIREILNAYYGNTLSRIFETLNFKELFNFWNLSQTAANAINYNLIVNNKQKFARLYNQIKPQGEKDYVSQLTKKDCENICIIVAQAIEMWSEIIGGISKETAKKQLLRKYNYNNKKIYSGGAKENHFFIMRGTIDPYIEEIKNYLLENSGQFFYLTNEQWSYYPWKKDFLEMSAKIELDVFCEEDTIFPKDFSFFICFGHEQEITFAGSIVEDIQKILAPVKHKFNKSILC